MVLPLIQMETTSRSTGKIHKASQGGLTPPKLYDSGADFRIEFAENTEGRQVRISCIFVAHHFCARVKSRIVSSSVYRCIPLYPLVAYRCMPLHTIAYHSIPLHTIAYYRILSHTIAYHRIPLHTIAYYRIPSYTVPPPVENDRTPSRGK